MIEELGVFGDVVRLTEAFMFIPVILAVVNEVVKRMFNVPQGRVAQVAISINIFGGMALGLVFAPIGTAVLVKLLAGFLAGAAASGLYDGIKTFITKK